MVFAKPLSAKTIADIIDAKCIGNENTVILGMNEVHIVEKGDLTFVDNPKYYTKALNSAATAIIIDKSDVEIPEGKVLLVSNDPLMSFNKLTEMFAPFRPATKAIADDAVIGEGTVIQPLVFIGHDVQIGKNCIIHSNVSINDHTIIGDNVIVNSGAVISSEAYYFQRRDNVFHKFLSSGGVKLDDNVEIGANCTVDRGVTGLTTIGEGTKLDNLVHLGHDTIIGKNCLIGAHSVIAGVTTIEDNVIVWGEVAINKDITIGAGAVILATSAVDKNLEPGKVYFGAPAIEASKKWREMVALKKLPDILDKLELRNNN
jgi:UDP-3-O-[3-hydroxymyristoyl] glucosamine N-acyltransferase